METPTKEEQIIIDKWNALIDLYGKIETIVHETEFKLDAVWKENHSSHGLVPPRRKAIFPKCDDGVEISIKEYGICTKYNVDLSKIKHYCISGRTMYHAVKRDHCRFGKLNLAATTTPFPGYYKIVNIKDDVMTCYYNYRDYKEFLEEDVDILKHAFFNACSQGNANDILEGDTIHVKDLDLVDENGRKKYMVEWEVL